MPSVENVNKISNYLRVSPGKLGYNADKIVTRTTKSNEMLSGYSTILLSLARESKLDIVQNINEIEYQCQVAQWFDYANLFVSNATRDRNVNHTVLNELNSYLATRSYLVGDQLSLADLAVYYTIQEVFWNLGPLDKETNLNVSRWFNHLQQQKAVRQGGDLVNFSTIFLLGWVSGTHV